MLTDNAGIVKDTNIYDPNGVAIARTNTGGITHGDLGYKSAYTDPNPTNTGDVKTGTGWYTPGTATNRSIRAEIPQLRATRGKLQTPTPLNTQTLGSLSSGVPNAGLCGDCGTPQIATPQITDIIEDNAGNSPEPAVEEPVATEQLQPDTTTTPDTTNQQEGATTNGDTPGQDTPDCGQCGQQEQTTQTGGADTTSTDTGQTGGATDQHNGDFCDAIWGCAVAMCTPSSSVNACEGSGGGGGGALPTCGSTEHIEDWGFGPICVPNYTPPPQPTPTTPFDPCTDLGFCRPDSATLNKAYPSRWFQQGDTCGTTCGTDADPQPGCRPANCVFSYYGSGCSCASRPDAPREFWGECKTECEWYNFSGGAGGFCAGNPECSSRGFTTTTEGHCVTSSAPNCWGEGAQVVASPDPRLTTVFVTDLSKADGLLVVNRCIASAIEALNVTWHIISGEWLVITEGYRDKAAQQWIYDHRCAVWNEPGCFAVAAPPGSSVHGTGLAFDFRSICPGVRTDLCTHDAASGVPLYDFLLKYGERYGLRQGLSNDKAHWSFFGN